MKITNALVIVSLGILVFAGRIYAIVGGGAPPPEFAGATAIVVIQKSSFDPDSMVCSAVVINSDHLLTAGHCVEDFSSPEKVTIMNPVNGRSISRNASVSMHPNYRIGFRNNPDVREIGADLAVLKLNQPVNFAVHSVRIPSASELGSIGTPVNSLLVAAGQDEFGRNGKVESLAVTSQWYSSRAPGVLQYLPRASGSGPCEQDSGGGIFYNNGREHLLIGISSSRSAGSRCGAPGTSGFAAAIASNLAWLNRVL